MIVLATTPTTSEWLSLFQQAGPVGVAIGMIVVAIVILWMCIGKYLTKSIVDISNNVRLSSENSLKAAETSRSAAEQSEEAAQANLKITEILARLVENAGRKGT